MAGRRSPSGLALAALAVCLALALASYSPYYSPGHALLEGGGSDGRVRLSYEVRVLGGGEAYIEIAEGVPPKPGPRLYFNRALVTVDLDLVVSRVTFTVNFTEGFEAEVIRSVEGGALNLTLNVTRTGVSFGYSREYALDPDSMWVFDSEGGWAGVLPYLVRVDPERPLATVFGVDSRKLLNGCALPVSLEGLIQELSSRLGVDIGYVIPEPGEVVEVPSGEFNFTQGGYIVIPFCVSLSLITVVADPRIPTSPYSVGGLEFSGGELVNATISLGLRALEAVRGANATLVSAGKVGLASAEGHLILAVRGDGIIDEYRRALEEVAGGPVSHVVFVAEPAVLPLEGRAAYHISGFLVSASIPVFEALASYALNPLLMPTLDLSIEYGLLTEGVELIEVRLVGVEGLGGAGGLAAEGGFQAPWLLVAVAAVSTAILALAILRYRRG